MHSTNSVSMCMYRYLTTQISISAYTNSHHIIHALKHTNTLSLARTFPPLVHTNPTLTHSFSIPGVRSDDGADTGAGAGSGSRPREYGCHRARAAAGRTQRRSCCAQAVWREDSARPLSRDAGRPAQQLPQGAAGAGLSLFQTLFALSKLFMFSLFRLFFSLKRWTSNPNILRSLHKVFVCSVLASLYVTLPISQRDLKYIFRPVVK